MIFNFSNQKRKPSVSQIIKKWKAEGKKNHFAVEYGETYAEFEYRETWDASGNGCRGVNRDAVLKELRNDKPLRD